jgi:hypothetical protein
MAMLNNQRVIDINSRISRKSSILMPNISGFRRTHQPFIAAIGEAPLPFLCPAGSLDRSAFYGWEIPKVHGDLIHKWENTMDQTGWGFPSHLRIEIYQPMIWLSYHRFMGKHGTKLAGRSNLPPRTSKRLVVELAVPLVPLVGNILLIYG